MPPKDSADLVIEARWVLPVHPANTVLEGHAVAVNGGRIAAIGPAERIRAEFEPREHIVRPGHALLPGLVDAHGHFAASAVSGRSDVCAEPQPSAGPDAVYEDTQLAIARMLRAGITTFAASGLYPEQAARAAAAARIRAAIGLPVSDVPNGWAEDASAHLALAEQMWDTYRSDPWISLYFALPGVSEVSDATLSRVRRVADELDARIAMPVHESAARVREALDRDGRRPLQRLHALGLLRPGFTALHLTQLDETDLDLAALTGLCAVACPQGDLRSGAGCCPVSQLESQQVGVSLGTDDRSGRGTPDILAEARMAALLSGLADAAPSGARPLLSAHGALRMATLGGANALGLASQVGSIEAGKAADLVCFDLGGLEFPPALPTEEALVFLATRSLASDVWTSGRAAVSAGRLLAFEELQIRHSARRGAGHAHQEILT